MSKKSDSMRIPDSSEPQWNCQRCGQRMQKWKHAPEWVPPTNKSWFAFWYECLNKGCRTRQVMPKGASVKPGGTAPTGGSDPAGGGFEYEQLLCAEDIQRLAHFRGI